MKKIIVLLLFFVGVGLSTVVEGSEMKSEVGIEFSLEEKKPEEKKPDGIVPKHLLPQTGESDNQLYTLLGIAILIVFVFYKKKLIRREGNA